MKNYLVCLAALISILSCKVSSPPSMSDIIDKSLDRAVEQSTLMYAVIDSIPEALPRSINPNGSLETSDSYFWTSGFYPGTLWYLYEYTKDDRFKEMAVKMSDRVEIQKFNTDNHDVGFMINCSFGNKLRLTEDSSCVDIIATTAKSLATRYRPTVGCTRSWSHPATSHWQFPVIIDNMMNLELLLKASKLTGNQQFHDIAISHANKTMANHFREDFSSYHVIDYDTLSGKAIDKRTWQGYSDNSAWSRGQSWALYGYTMMYRETKDKRYLEQANHIASFLINHPNLPDDKIPYWDFDDPKIPNTLRDASAAAIMASALIELSAFADAEQGKNYMAVAEKQLRTLSSDEYLAKKGENGNFILKHSVGFLPQNSEVDVPLTYADYYFIEALMRYKALKP
ncbi:glycoside hydrolase family 88 protein [Pseudopedobacter beijingensis]|uniref:Glycoside hydrolase family 88 protein n=1 Tax=Pseudopedobacter beijingensis TaxID=1207056 RepID=A0ABW4I7P5_9SPHI